MRVIAARVSMLAAALTALGMQTHSQPVIWLAFAFGLVSAGALAAAVWGGK